MLKKKILTQIKSPGRYHIVDHQASSEIMFIYDNYSMEFAWGKKTKDSVSYTSGFFSCREEFSYDYRSRIEDKYNTPHNNNRIQLFVLNKGDITKRLRSCINLLNTIEKCYGYPKSDVYVVKPIDTESKRPYNLLFFDGSKNWLKSIHMISLFTLIIRIGMTNSFVEIKDPNNIDPKESMSLIIKKLKTMAKEKNKKYRCAIDAERLLEASKFFKVILSKNNALFKGLSSDYLYNDIGSIQDGINSLCTQQTNYTKLLDNFVMLCKKYNIPLKDND